MSGVSRTDLLAWLNEALQLNYTKIEQCGSGGAYCQILDSIYSTSRGSCLYAVVHFSLVGDIPMNRVKMNAKHEYEFVANYKILQNIFKAHKIDKVGSPPNV
jgi:RP/EB family microtubule-associated protein